MGAVEALGVAAVDEAQSFRDPVARAAEDEVVVVRHQAEDVRVKPLLRDRETEEAEEVVPVGEGAEDVLLPRAARRDVEGAVGGKDRAGKTSHLSQP